MSQSALWQRGARIIRLGGFYFWHGFSLHAFARHAARGRGRRPRSYSAPRARYALRRLTLVPACSLLAPSRLSCNNWVDLASRISHSAWHGVPRALKTLYRRHSVAASPTGSPLHSPESKQITFTYFSSLISTSFGRRRCDVAVFSNENFSSLDPP